MSAPHSSITHRSIPPLHILTSDDVVARVDFEDVARQLLATIGPLGALHLRTRVLSGSKYVALARRLADHAHQSNSCLLVNERVDVALAANAHGVQLGRGALTSKDVSLLVSRAGTSVDPTFRIGASVHSLEEATITSGVDWLIFGQLFESKSHPGVTGTRVEALRAITKRVSIPIIAVGGITVERVGEALATGAAGVAVISGIWDEKEPNLAAIRYLSEYGDWTGRGPSFPHG